MITGARAIVTGRVASIETGYDESQHMVFTYVKLQVGEVIKGQITSRTIVIKELGGEFGNRGTYFYGIPRFTLEENVLLYLDTRSDGSLRTHQMFLGKFSIEIDPQTGVRYAVREKPESHVHIVAAPEAHQESHGAATSRMELTAYATLVRERLAANWHNAIEFEQRYYAGIPILEEPAEYSLRAAAGMLAPQFTLLAPSTPIRWFEPDSGQPVTFRVRPDGAPGSSILDDVTAACAAWTGLPGSNLSVANGGSTSQCQSSQGVNTIVFNNCDSAFSPSPCGSGIVLALGGISSYNPGITKVVNGTTFARAISGHVSFNPSASCFFGTRCNVQEVLTHEIGHVLGFGHSADGSATMYFQAHFDGRCASVRADEVAGVNFVYPSGGGGGGGGGNPTITTSSPLPGGFVGSSYAQTLSASGGTPPYIWSLISGSLPPGLTLSSGGAISGTPAAAGTASFTVQVLDAQSRTAQKGFSLSVSSSGSGSQLSATFVSQSVPSTLNPSQSFNVTMTWRNTGATAWSEAAGVRIGSQNPSNNTTWGGNRIILPADVVVQPGQDLAVTVTVFAPAVPGTYNFQWQMIHQSQGFFGQPSSNAVISVGSTPTLTIGGPSLLDVVRGTAFSHQLSASGGTQPYTWSIVSGALPPGSNLNTSSGLISGTPPTAGSFGFTVQARDSASRSATKAMTINVLLPPVEVVITTTSLSTGVRGMAYTQQLHASGGAQPYSWSVSGGALPAGLILNSSGLLSGNPTVTGSFSISFTARELGGATGNRSLILTVLGPEALPKITKVKYKLSGKLIVTGEFQVGATLLLDEVAVSPKFADAVSIVVKKLALSRGTHTVRVINTNGLSSESRQFTVQ
jgi:hypothetical protein